MIRFLFEYVENGPSIAFCGVVIITIPDVPVGTYWIVLKADGGETVPESDLLGGGFERGMYEDMLFEGLSSLSARAEAIGIAELLYRSFAGDGAEAETSTG